MAIYRGLPRVFHAVDQVGRHLCQKNTYTEDGSIAMEFVTPPAWPTRLLRSGARSG
jgi:hypothetical protein